MTTTGRQTLPVAALGIEDYENDWGQIYFPSPNTP